MLHTLRCSVGRSGLAGALAAPPSKSYTHRAVFAASLADGTSAIAGPLISEDTRATISAAEAFGAQVERDGDVLRIVGRPRPRPASIDAKNSGTTIRIAAAIASLAPGTTTLTGDASLRARPMGPLLDSLESLGARCGSDNGTPPVSVAGPISGGRAQIRGDISSQFVSALLMAAPCTPDGLALSVEGSPVSAPYIGATISVMERFGASVSAGSENGEYFVAPRRYTPSQFTVPSDYSSLALLLAASVLAGGDLRITAGDGGLPQGDAVFADHLRALGAEVESDGGVFRTDSPESLRGGSFDLRGTPDLLPPLAILALKCDEGIRITGVAHARKKETDRISALAAQLGRLGLRVEEGEDSLFLRRGTPRPADLDSGGDHRIFMALCIACMYTGGSVGGAESASVSYPGFVDQMRSVGAEISCA